MLDLDREVTTTDISDVTNAPKSGSAVITTSQSTISFSSAFSDANYEVFITDNDGVGWENLTNKTASGFDITGLSNGTIDWTVIYNN